MDVGWFAEDALPDVVAGVDLWREHAFRAIRGESVDVLYDQPRTPPWQADDAVASGAKDHEGE
jgi:hypothetical protein